MLRYFKVMALMVAAAWLLLPQAALGQSMGYPMYHYVDPYSVPEPPTPLDEELSKKVEAALEEWTKENFPGQGKIVSKAVVVGQKLYLVMSLWWKDMGFTSRLKKTEALWEFWAAFFKKEGPRYAEYFDKDDLKVFLIDNKGHPLGGSHTHGEARAWVVQ